MAEGEWPELVEEAARIWEQNAAFWAEYMGAGNNLQRHLTGPSSERLLALEPGESILEIGCGHGVFSRRLAELGGRVVAVDASETFVAAARQRSHGLEERLQFRCADATDEAQLLALGAGRFDAAVASMVLMDLPVIRPLLRALARLLAPRGRFVFSITHPFVNGPTVRKVLEEEDHAGTLVLRRGVHVTAYITPTATKGLGVVGQPVPHYYFHRPLALLLAECFAVGFTVDGMLEPVYPPEVEGRSPLSWSCYKELPPVLVVRLRAPAV